MKPISRLVGALALSAVITPAAFCGDATWGMSFPLPHTPTVPQPTSLSGTSTVPLPASPSTPSKPCVVRPVYVVSMGARNGSAESAVRAARNVELTQDLVAILNETKSPDVLLMTMETLAEIKAEPRLVIPAIIRNAERLSLLEGICTSEKRNSDQKKILDVLEFFTRRTRMVARSKKPVPTTASTPSGIGSLAGGVLGAAAGCSMQTYVLPPKSVPQCAPATPAPGLIPPQRGFKSGIPGF